MIAASACLLGHRCRYDGRTCPSQTLVARAQKETILPVCPEQLGGLETPRIPCDLKGGDGFAVLEGRARVVDRAGNDRTDAFVQGAFSVLQLLRENNVRLCFLKDGSPS